MVIDNASSEDKENLTVFFRRGEICFAEAEGRPAF